MKAAKTIRTVLTFSLLVGSLLGCSTHAQDDNSYRKEASDRGENFGLEFRTFTSQPAAGFRPAIGPARTGESGATHWTSTLGQSLLFLGIEHSLRLGLDPPSRTALKGNFWGDYAASLRELGHWKDGNPMFINYVGHPLQGSVTGFIQIQNDPGGRSLQISWSRQYRNSRLKALAWSAVYSTYFEIGVPLSEAALGNLGVDKHRRTQQGMVDIIITPTLGLSWLIMEDFVDSYVVGRLEQGRTGNSRKLIRSLLNPTRSFSNVLRFKYPWYRDGRP